MTETSVAGGRVTAMLRLRRLAADAELNAPRMAIVYPQEIREFDVSQRPLEPGLMPRPDDIPADLETRWNTAWNALQDCLLRVWHELRSPAGLPVLKASYISNVEPHHLSFAGVGATAVNKGKEPNVLGGAVSKILRARYRGLPVYYRQAHQAARNLDIGLLALEYIPKQKIWGVLWGGANGFVCHCSLENHIPYQYATFMVGWSAGRTEKTVPDWLNGPAFNLLENTARIWSSGGQAESHFDVEFCISENDTLTLTQWRPIPERLAQLLDATVARGSSSLGPSPFSSAECCSGRVVLSHSLPEDQLDLVERMCVAEHEIWVVPYRDAGVDLFRLLVAAQSRPGLKLPTLIVTHVKNTPLGHLHAILHEDSRLSSAIHCWKEEADFNENTNINLSSRTDIKTASRWSIISYPSKRLIKPRALRIGDQIGVFSPSSSAGAVYPERWKRAVTALSVALEVETVVGCLGQRARDYRSGSARERAEELMSLLLNPSINAVIAATGGFNANGLLEWLDYDSIRSSPKIIIGYSDTAALLLGIHAATGLVTFHGPSLLSQFGEWAKPQDFTLRALKAAICSTTPIGSLQPSKEIFSEWEDWNATVPRPRPGSPAVSWEPWRHGTANGRLVCGNIETLNCLVGSPFLPDMRDSILCVEATGAEAYLPRFERALTHFRIAGILERISGLVIARCPDAAPLSGRTLRDVVLEVVGNIDIPIAAEVDFGHTDPILTLPIGCQSRLEVGESGVNFSISESSVTL